MGKRAETVAVGIGWKDTQFRSRQTHHVGISPQEDRGGTAGAVGEGEGCEEEIGGLVACGACCEDAAGFRA